MKSAIVSMLLVIGCVVAIAALERPPSEARAQALVEALTAPAPTAVTPPDVDPTSTAGQAFDAFKAGKYFAGICLLVILGVWALRKYGGAWFQSDRGGAVLALLVGQATAFASAAAAGALNPGTIIDAVIAGLVLATAGAGARHIAKNGVAPPDKA